MPKVLQDSTPLMRQYFEIKSKYKDTILLYRMGDFYETFDEDAKLVHKILGITLTKRANGKAAHVALAGFPYHSLDSYMPKLIRSGFRVAVCEQVEDPKTAKGIVRRDVTEIVTPGTTLSDKILDQKTNNFLACIATGMENDKSVFGLSILDASTGEFYTGQLDHLSIINYLKLVHPSEIVVSFSAYDQIKNFLKPLGWFPVITRQDDWLFNENYAYDILLSHFKTHSLKGFGIENLPLGLIAAGVIFHYLKETQRTSLSQINGISVIALSGAMMIDSVTLQNLDIFDSSSSDNRFGSLISVLDHTQTAMGGRMMKQWIMRPLKNTDHILARIQAVDELISNPVTKNSLINTLKEIGDIERLISKICAGRANPREVRALSLSLDLLPEIKKIISDCDSANLCDIQINLPDLTPIVEEIINTLVDEPSIQIKDGNVIRSGFSSELDNLKNIAFNGKNYLSQLQNKERERTGINSLKVQFNQVFGYYIEITHAHKDKIPTDYIRKQTMVNAERFITPELKEFEEKILTAEEKIQKLELEYFENLRNKIAKWSEHIQKAGRLIAELDCYCSFAETAIINKYTKPEFNTDGIIEITNGRHPVVEKILPPDQPFIPNDVRLTPEEQILLITGPNMAGKSCYLKQTGLIVLLAQTGSFVPADKANISIVDRIFTRVGASDNLAAGESTFLVEMNETASILNNATSQSLILLDEIGRGTSTFDGLSIAWAVVEYLHNHPVNQPKTLFATHYHELVEIAELLPRVRNYNMLVNNYQDKIVFGRKVVPGGCDHSYGIEVAKLAGLPQEVILRAKEVMQNLESHEISAHQDKASLLQHLQSSAVPSVQLTLFGDPVVEKIKNQISGLDIDRLTPIEALNQLNEIKNYFKQK